MKDTKKINGEKTLLKIHGRIIDFVDKIERNKTSTDHHRSLEYIEDMESDIDIIISRFEHQQFPVGLSNLKKDILNELEFGAKTMMATVVTKLM